VTGDGRSSRRILFLEPFYGGSHRAFAEGLRRHSRHRIDLMTLPARFWKWRMRGAALHFIRTVPDLGGYDGLLATDLMSLADFKALAPTPCPPAMVYFHENQLTYPLAPGERMDVQYGFTDITTGLAARQMVFNSRTHLNAFFDALPRFVGQMPEYRPRWVIDALRGKSTVIHPGCAFADGPPDLRPVDGAPPLIVWNHRWEFDKDPDTFFSALDALAARGIDFRLALLGENFQVVPKAFVAARERLGDRVVRYGYEADRQAYVRWLRRGAVAVSTANQENFGISVIEAVRHGCIPVLPDRLSYPEILPDDFHADCLYGNPVELVDKLAGFLTNPQRRRRLRRPLAEAMAGYAWTRQILAYDRALAALSE
jgi:glycosyltransferase involved in cell wall biosynthesis